MMEKIEWYREVLDLEPNSKVFFPLARMLAAEHEYDAAIETLEKGLERHKEFLEARLFLIEILHATGRKQQCDDQIEQLSKMFASYAGFWQAWAACLDSKRDEADTASILRFLAAQFISGPLQIHDVLNRGVESILQEKETKKKSPLNQVKKEDAPDVQAAESTTEPDNQPQTEVENLPGAVDDKAAAAASPESSSIKAAESAPDSAERPAEPEMDNAQAPSPEELELPAEDDSSLPPVVEAQPDLPALEDVPQPGATEPEEDTITASSHAELSQADDTSLPETEPKAGHAASIEEHESDILPETLAAVEGAQPQAQEKAADGASLDQTDTGLDSESSTHFHLDEDGMPLMEAMSLPEEDAPGASLPLVEQMAIPDENFEKMRLRDSSAVAPASTANMPMEEDRPAEISENDTPGAIPAPAAQEIAEAAAPEQPETYEVAEAGNSREKLGEENAENTDIPAFSIKTRSMAEVLAEQGDLKGALDIYQELEAAAGSEEEAEDIKQRMATLQAKLGATVTPIADSAAVSKEKLIDMLEALAHRVEERVKNPVELS